MVKGELDLGVRFGLWNILERNHIIVTNLCHPWSLIS